MYYYTNIYQFQYISDTTQEKWLFNENVMIESK